MGTPTETYSPGPCTVGAGNLRSLPNSRGRHSHRLRHEWCPWMCVVQRPGLEFPPPPPPPPQWTLAPGWDGRGKPTPSPQGHSCPCGHQPQATVKSGSRALSVPRALVLGAVQPGDWRRSSRSQGGDARAHPGDTACSL